MCWVVVAFGGSWCLWYSHLGEAFSRMLLWSRVSRSCLDSHSWACCSFTASPLLMAPHGACYPTHVLLVTAKRTTAYYIFFLPQTSTIPNFLFLVGIYLGRASVLLHGSGITLWKCPVRRIPSLQTVLKLQCLNWFRLPFRHTSSSTCV